MGDLSVMTGRCIPGRCSCGRELRLQQQIEGGACTAAQPLPVLNPGRPRAWRAAPPGHTSHAVSGLGTYVHMCMGVDAHWGHFDLFNVGAVGICEVSR